MWPILAGIIILSLLLSGCGGAQIPKMYRVGILSGLNAFASSETMKTRTKKPKSSRSLTATLAMAFLVLSVAVLLTVRGTGYRLIVD